MNPSTADVAVLGAGPAGCAAALAAARAGRSVVLFDPRAEAVDVPCGEGLMPEGVAALRLLGLGDVVDAGRSFDAITFVTPRGRRLRAPLPGGCSVKRPDLQRALDATVRAEPSIVRVVARASTRPAADGGFVIAWAEGRLSAAAVVVACGLEGGGLEDERTRGSGATRPGLRARFRAGPRAFDGVEVHLGGGSEIYLTTHADGSIAAAALFRATANATSASRLFDDALRRHPYAADALGSMIVPPAARPIAQRSSTCLARGGRFLAGDSALAVDPIVGCGVSLALVGGLRAGAAAAAVATGADADARSRAYEHAVRAAAAPRARLARMLGFLSKHDLAADLAASMLARAPRLLAWLAGGAGRNSATLVTRSEQ
jgi:flavin-dependent dehydrogenase